MSNPTMPKFNFDGCSIKDDGELEAELAKSSRQDKYFRPGKHDVVIKAVEFTGLAKNDDSWGQLSVTYEGTGEKTMMDFILFPFKDVKYGPKATLYPFKKLQSFCSALGVELKASNIKDVMTKTFGKPEKLVGSGLSIDVGYQKAYAKWTSKDASGANLYNLILADGSVAQENGVAKTFPGYEAVEAYATEKKIGYDKFCQVTSYYPGQVKTEKPAW